MEGECVLVGVLKRQALGNRPLRSLVTGCRLIGTKVGEAASDQQTVMSLSARGWQVRPNNRRLAQLAPTSIFDGGAALYAPLLQPRGDKQVCVTGYKS